MSIKFFALLGTLTLFLGCGESISDETTTGGMSGNMNTQMPAPDESNKIELTPCEQATSADLSACASTIYALKDANRTPDDARIVGRPVGVFQSIDC